MLTITQKADEYIRKTGMQEIRFGVKTNKGCAGFEYIWQQGYPSINDYRININDNYTLLIDKSLKKYVDDCEIDLETLDDKLGNKIVFNNIYLFTRFTERCKSIMTKNKYKTVNEIIKHIKDSVS